MEAKVTKVTFESGECSFDSNPAVEKVYLGEQGIPYPLCAECLKRYRAMHPEVR